MPQNNNIRFIRDPDLKHVEARFSRYTHNAFKKHTHDAYAIGVIEQGCTSFSHLNRTDIVGPGTITLINPGEVHACNPHADSVWSYRMFYVDIDLIQNIGSELCDRHDGFLAFTQAIVRNSSLYNSLLRLYTVLLTSDDTLGKTSLVHETLSQLVLNYSGCRAISSQKESTWESTQKVYEYLMDNVAQNISLHKLSSVAGLSAYHLLRAFRERFGLPPHTFQLQQRINIAKRMLADGISIVQVAFELGFSDQSHFTKKFKVFVGATPRQYQMALH